MLNQREQKKGKVRADQTLLSAPFNVVPPISLKMTNTT